MYGVVESQGNHEMHLLSHARVVACLASSVCACVGSEGVGGEDVQVAAGQCQLGEMEFVRGFGFSRLP